MTEQLECRRLLSVAVNSVDITTDIAPRDGIEILFDGDVDHATVTNDDVRVENLTTGGSLVELEPIAAGSNRLRVEFADSEYLDLAGSRVRLPDGYYEVTLDAGADGVLDLMGFPIMADDPTADVPRYTSGDQLSFLNGDFNHDGFVDLSDHTILRSGFGVGSTFAEGDANGDGSVGLADFTELRSQFGKALEAPPDRYGEVLATLATAESIELSWVLPGVASEPDAWHLFRGTGDGIDYDDDPVAVLTADGSGGTVAYSVIKDVVLEDGSTADMALFSDAGLIDGTRYRYDLRAWSHVAGLSPSTDLAAERTLLPSPDNASASLRNNGDVAIEWTTTSTTQDQFRIEYRTSPTDEWQLAEVITDPSVTQSVLGGLQDPASLEFQISAEQVFDDGTVSQASAYSMPFIATVGNGSFVVEHLNLWETRITWSGDHAVQPPVEFWVSYNGGDPIPWTSVATDSNGGSFTFSAGRTGNYEIFATQSNSLLGSGSDQQLTMVDGERYYEDVSFNSFWLMGPEWLGNSSLPEFEDRGVSVSGAPDDGAGVGSTVTLQISGLPEHAAIRVGVEWVSPDTPYHETSLTIDDVEVVKPWYAGKASISSGWVEHSGGTYTLQMQVGGDDGGEIKIGVVKVAINLPIVRVHTNDFGLSEPDGEGEVWTSVDRHNPINGRPYNVTLIDGAEAENPATFKTDYKVVGEVDIPARMEQSPRADLVAIDDDEREGTEIGGLRVQKGNGFTVDPLNVAHVSVTDEPGVIKGARFPLSGLTPDDVEGLIDFGLSQFGATPEELGQLIGDVLDPIPFIPGEDIGDTIGSYLRAALRNAVRQVSAVQPYISDNVITQVDGGPLFHDDDIRFVQRFKDKLKVAGVGVSVTLTADDVTRINGDTAKQWKQFVAIGISIDPQVLGTSGDSEATIEFDLGMKSINAKDAEIEN